MPSSRGSSPSSNRTCISCITCIANRLFTAESLWKLAQNHLIWRKLPVPIFPLEKKRSDQMSNILTFQWGCLKGQFLSPLSQSTDGMWYSPDVQGLLRTKEPCGMLLIHRMCDAIDRGYYCSVASHSGRKKRVEHTLNDPAFHESARETGFCFTCFTAQIGCCMLQMFGG